VMEEWRDGGMEGWRDACPTLKNEKAGRNACPTQTQEAARGDVRSGRSDHHQERLQIGFVAYAKFAADAAAGNLYAIRVLVED